jgi:ADP-heptose:LPS heptosyltransferase
MNPKTILIVKPSSLGDIVHTLRITQTWKVLFAFPEEVFAVLEA